MPMLEIGSKQGFTTELGFGAFSPPLVAADGTEKQGRGIVEFFVGPSRLPSSWQCPLKYHLDVRPLLRLALIAAEFGKTSVFDDQGIAVVFDRFSQPEVEIF